VPVSGFLKDNYGQSNKICVSAQQNTFWNGRAFFGSGDNFHYLAGAGDECDSEPVSRLYISFIYPSDNNYSLEYHRINPQQGKSA
jgi:hypothetical protein